MKKTRPIYEIATEIKNNWKNPYFGAVPYIDAMGSLSSVNDNYMFDSAESVLRYFLGNAGTWRGETARKVKSELKSMLK